MTEQIKYTYTDCPLGKVRLTCNSQGITSIRLEKEGYEPAPAEWSYDEDTFGNAIAQLEQYFAGTLEEFDLPLAPQGTPFQQQVWQALQEIPYGTTTSYGELANRLGKPIGAARAVGAANGKNPIWIVIPCHRVIGSSGALTGYAGGLDVKEALLDLERKSHPDTYRQMSLLDEL